VLTVLIQTTIEAGILVFVLILVGNLSWSVLLFPYILLLLALFSLGIGLVLSLLNVYLRDINYLVSIAMNLLFYGTPIVYTFELVQEHAPTWAQTLIKLNPLTQFVGASRDIFYGMEVPSLTRMAGLTAVSALTFLAGWSIFTTKSKDVSEEL
jgi:ABC-type polysaccharide/polyol phosphate export permease